jgi:hypothetical protein
MYTVNAQTKPTTRGNTSQQYIGIVQPRDTIHSIEKEVEVHEHTQYVNSLSFITTNTFLIKIYIL